MRMNFTKFCSVLIFFLIYNSYNSFGQCLSISTTVQNVSCFGGNDGKINLTITPGGSPNAQPPFAITLNYVDSFGGKTILASYSNVAFTTITFTPGNGSLNIPGADAFGIPANGSDLGYEVTVIATGGTFICRNKTITSIQVTEPSAALTANLISVDPDCNPLTGSGTGNININTTGGTSPYTFLWNDGSASEDRTLLDAGTYHLDVTDSKLCTTSIDVTVPVVTQANAGIDQIVCADNTVLAGNSAGVGEIGTWTVVAGTGIFANANSPTTSVGSLSLGNNQFKWTITDSGGICTGTSSIVNVDRNTPASVDAGPPVIICSGSTATMAGTFGGSATSATWSKPATADGSFNNVALANAVYTPGPADIAAGSVILTYTTNDPLGPCPAASDVVTVTINTPATVNPGPPQNICSGGTATLAATFGGSATGVSWSKPVTADGSFSNITDPNAVYTPGPNDILNGSVILTVTTDDPAGPCPAASNTVTITINPTPTITLGANPSVCSGTTTANLPYSATTGSPNQYSIDFNAAANTAGFTDVVNAALTATPIVITVPGAASAATYSATLTVRNSVTGCVSSSSPITVTINPAPTLTLGPNPSVCSGTTTANVTYSAVAGGADQYSIDFNAAANAAGFADVAVTALPASPIVITVPGAAAAATYNATITVINSTTTCSTTTAISVTINATPSITPGANPSVCLGSTTANLSYGGAVGSPDQYSIDFDAAANLAGFADVVNAALPATPIVITVPGAAAAATYNGNLSVRNSVTGCVGISIPITVTIVPLPTITLGANPSVCAGTTTANLTYSATTGTPNQYSIDFNAAANTAGFADVVNAALPASPIVITVPGAAAAATYSATLTVRNSVTGCVSSSTPITVTINPAPNLTLGANPSVCSGTTTANLTYSAVVGGADQYSINFNAAANAAGFADVAVTALPASPIVITVPGAAAAATYNATITIINSTTTCSTTRAISVTINAIPSITPGANPSVCLGSTTANLSYGGAVGSPNQYSIDFDAAANLAGFTDVVNAALPATPIVITVPGAAAAATYNGTLTVRRSATGCVSSAIPITVTINPIPTITLGANPSVCSGTTTANLPYSATTGSPDQYSIDFNAAANTAGFTDVVNAALTATPIVITVPAASAATYSATLTVRNSVTGCVSSSSPITVTINPAPTLTLGPNPSVCSGTTTANVTYSAVAGGADQYSIDFNAAANAAGFADVAVTALPASPIVITVPGAAAAATYNATITVINSTTTCSTTTAISVTINATPSITPGANPSVCLGSTTANLSYGGAVGSPDQYSIDFDAAANLAGFADVVNAALPATPIVITVPGAAAAATYNGTLTVRNSVTGCVSSSSAITVTISPIPTITLGANPSVCAGTTTANLTYSATTGSPDQYSIDFNAAANTAGFADVVNAALTASPIVITVPGAASAATYSATLTIRNSVTGCVSSSSPITVTINPAPTLTLGANPSVCSGTTTANLTYSAVVGGADQYSIDFDAVANAAGFADVAVTALPASPIVITVPGAAAAATYNATITVINSTTTCSTTTAISVTISATPSITPGANPSVCLGSTTANLSYGGAVGSPDQYSIDFDAAANLAGFADVVNAVLPATPIVITVPGGAGVATYNGTLTVRNSITGCVSGSSAITVTINPIPAITLGANPFVCSGGTVANLTYSTPTGSPDQYSIDFDAAAEAAGFTDVVNAVLPATPVVITVPGGAADGVYNATFTVSNSTTSCSGASSAITVTIGKPSVILGANPTVCSGVTTANLSYSTPIGSPDQYSIDFDAVAEAAGFVDVINAVLPATPIIITVPGAAGNGTYNATLTVTSTAAGCSGVSNAIAVTIGLPAVTLGTYPSVCSGVTTANLSYNSPVGSPDTYSIDFDAAAEAAGFVDVVNAVLPVSPIVITVPGAASNGVYNATLTVTNSVAGCSSAATAITVTIGLPTITLGANPSVCSGVTTANLPYAATTSNPDQYSIDFDAAAEAAGFVDVVNAVLTSTPIAITVPGAAGSGVYNATLTVTNSVAGCTSTATAITVTIGLPTITLGTNPSVCSGVTTANLPYSATTSNPDQYSIDFDVAAEAAGFVDVVNAALPVSPIVITVPGAAANGVYNATLTVTNSVAGCSSAATAITVTIGLPTITLGTNPSVCSGVTTANLSYTATTSSPDQYSIDFDAAAEAVGFVDVVNAVLPLSPITITVPVAGPNGVYNGVLTVTNSAAGCSSSGAPITVTIGLPAITLGANPSVCSGVTTANLSYSSPVGGPDQYSIDFDAAAEAAGFVDVVNASLPVAPIVITVPGAAANGVYNATLTVTNSVAGCSSAATAITVTIGLPTITLGTNPSVCSGVTTANLPYSATTSNPNQYSIDFDAAAEAAGFVDVVNAALPVSPIAITVPGAAANGVYNATLTVTNSVAGCSSVATAITVTIGLPTITLGTNPSVCSGVTTASLPYSATTSSPDQYSIDFDAAAEAAGFVDVSNAVLTSSPIAITVPGAAGNGVYNATLTVTNSVAGCTSVATAITVTIGLPTITLGTNPSVCSGATTGNLVYSATTSSPDQYSIDFDLAAETAGFVDVVNATLPSTPIVITIPGAAAAAVYNGTITVTNSSAGCTSAGTAITVTINPTPSVALGANPSVCSGVTTANLSYNLPVGSPDKYSIDFDAAAEAAGFVDVVNAVLPVSPIAITVPGAAANGVYNATLTVTNSVAGCSSVATAITVTIGLPTITLGTNPSVCSGVTTANLPYSATTSSPDQYSIDFDVAAEAAGFVDVVNAVLTSSPIAITVPGAAGNGVYNATLTVTNSVAGCTSTATPVTVTIGLPTITLGTNPSVCSGVTTANLLYSATTSNPDQYSIDFDVAAEAAGFVDVSNAALTSSPIAITVPGAAGNGVYNATLTVSNSVAGCTSAATAITVTIGLPTITLGTNPTVCSGATTANLTYSATTSNPDVYSLDFDPAAEAAGFVDVVNAALTSSPIAITVPGAAANGVYNATLTVSNSSTAGCTSTGKAVTVTIGLPTITLGTNPTVCSGVTSANLSYSATTSSPDQYSIDFDAAAEAAGFVDVVNATLPVTPIVITVPAAAANGLYNGLLTVTNSAVGCTSVAKAITVRVNTITVANAGLDQVLCGAAFSTTLDANIPVPAVETGFWTIISGLGGTVVSINDPKSQFFGITGASYTLRWIITDGSCTATTDNVVINFAASPTSTSPVTACVNTSAPTLTATAVGATSIDWFTNPLLTPASHVATGNNYTPGAELNMGTVGSITYYVVATYSCGASPATQVVVNVSNTGSCGGGGGGTIDCTLFTVTPVISEIVRPSCSGKDDGVITFDISGTAGGNYIIQLLIPSADTLTQIGPAGRYKWEDLSAGNYQYKIEDKFGNTCQQPYSLPLQTTVTASASSFTDAQCFGAATGTAVLNASNSGTGDYYYSVDNGANWTIFTPGNVVNGLPPNGTYNILVGESPTDACRVAVSVTVNNANPAIDVTYDVKSATCNNNDGEINNIQASGGAGGAYQFSLDGVTFQSTNSFTQLFGGFDTLRIKDNIGCIGSSVIHITFPGEIDFLATPSSATCSNNGKSGEIDVTFAAADDYKVGISTDPLTEPINYLDDPFNSTTFPPFTGLSRGTYYVWVKGANSACPSRQTVFVDGVFTLSFTPVPICQDNLVSLRLENVTYDPNGGPISILFDDFTTGVNQIEQPIGQSPDILLDVNQSPWSNFFALKGKYRYHLEQFQTNFCLVKSDTLIYEVFDQLQMPDTLTVKSFDDQQEGEIHLTNFSGGLPPYTIDISANRFAERVDEVQKNNNLKYEMIYKNLYPDDYTIVLTDSLGCSVQFVTTVHQDFSLFIPNIFTPNGDSDNPVFFIRNLPDNSKLVITNRWGKEVFSSNKYGNDWSGDGVSDGIYYYYLKTSKDTRSGWVEVLRGNKP